jgi:hypothetical protein
MARAAKACNTPGEVLWVARVSVCRCGVIALVDAGSTLSECCAGYHRASFCSASNLKEPLRCEIVSSSRAVLGRWPVDADATPITAAPQAMQCF